jgi:hypothetical protein
LRQSWRRRSTHSPQQEIEFGQLPCEGMPLYGIGGHAGIPGPIDPFPFGQAAAEKHDTPRP